MVPDMIVAIDGYSSTGKSTFAKLLSSKLGYLYLDSGALYRGVTLFALEGGFFSPDGELSGDFPVALSTLELRFSPDAHLMIGDRVVDGLIRSMEVNSRVSLVSAQPYVREFVDGKLRDFGAGGRVVMDGRDIGTAVFPDAQLKIFMVADEMVRARRRHAELLSAGGGQTLEEVAQNLRLRDYTDTHRATHPLVMAEDAYVLDNTDMSLKEELCWVQGLIQGKFGLNKCE